MVDPVSAIGMATAAYNGIKQAISVGKEIQDMGSQLGQWSKAISDLDFAHKQAENPPMFKKVFGSSQIQQNATLRRKSIKISEIFAFFFGIAGAGMSILTPDTGYGFPAVAYIQNQIGHTVIILGVTYAMVIDNQRPYLKDVARALGFATILLFIMYGVNYLLGPPANYWFIVEKPIGDNVTSFMRPEPFHMIDIWLLAVVVCYLIYLPYYFQDRKAK